MEYSRAQPSPRYLALAEQYRRMHSEGEVFLGIPAVDTFPGLSLPAQAGRIKKLIANTGAGNILDYGCGKGRQYDLRNVNLGAEGVWESIQDYWDVDFVQCYDPSYPPFEKLPDRTFHGVICTDVLEHCPEQDIPWILAEIFGFAERFVFANVACYPARKRLPSGENAHCTIRPLEWWQQAVEHAAASRPDVQWEVWVTSQVGAAEGSQLVEQCLKSTARPAV
jgi:hypothetical protein